MYDYLSNTTTTLPVVPPYNISKDEFGSYLLHGVQGAVIFAANAPVFATIARYSALNLEKEYVVVAGLSLADGLNGLASMFSGAYRCTLIAFDQHMDLLTPWECMWKAHNLLWIWTDTVAPLMLLVVSVDRLLSVSMPMRYLSLPDTYARILVGSAYVYSLISGATGVLASWLAPSVARFPAVCYTSAAMGRLWWVYYMTVNTMFAFVSIPAYLLILIIGRTYYRKKMEELMKDNRDSSQAMKRRAERQKKMTESLAISCCFTFFFYCVPYGFGALFTTTTLSMLLYVVANLNPMLNILIYWKRHREVRMGVRALFAGRSMPPRLHIWLANETQQQATTTQSSRHGRSRASVRPI